MKYFIKNVEIKDSNSKWNLKKVDVCWSNGKIQSITNANNTTLSDAIHVEGNELYLTPSWIDLRTNIQDPGLEYKENLSETAYCGIQGGYGILVSMPKTQPIVQTKDTISYIKTKSKELPLDILPMAALSKNLEGKELNELMDLYQYGAVGFTDADACIYHSGLMIRALQYTQHTKAFVMQHAEETPLTAYGQMHEGEVSTYLGLKGLPALAEKLIILRDIELLKYSGGRIHFSRISTSESVDVIRQAKQDGLHVTCDVSVAHLAFTDKRLLDFETVYKLNPPLRTEKDRLALWEGIHDGTIDAIVTDHNAQDIESKEVEFDEAAHGMTMLETAFSLLLSTKPKQIPIEKVHEVCTSGPAKILGIKDWNIEQGNHVPLTLWDEKLEWQYSATSKKTPANNSPLMNVSIIGKAYAVFSKTTMHSIK